MITYLHLVFYSKYAKYFAIRISWNIKYDANRSNMKTYLKISTDIEKYLTFTIYFWGENMIETKNKYVISTWFLKNLSGYTLEVCL